MYINLKNNDNMIMKRTIFIAAAIAVTALFAASCTQQTEKSERQGYTDKEAIANILARKSVRVYLDKLVEQEKLDLIIRAGMAAPSGMDRRPWEIMVVDDKEAMAAMSQELPYAPMLAKAPVAIIVFGDSELSSYWYLDCSAVVQNILLAAEALDLGAVWTAAYPYEERMSVVSKYIPGIPGRMLPLAIIPMGYPDGDFQPKDKFDQAKIHYNKW